MQEDTDVVIRKRKVFIYKWLKPHQIKKWFELEEKNGIRFGYPRCCIDEYLQKHKTFQKFTKHQYAASNNSGFLPCESHSEQIIQNKIIITDLISTRITRKRRKYFTSVSRGCQDDLYWQSL
jgi:hypothetical protein